MHEVIKSQPLGHLLASYHEEASRRNDDPKIQLYNYLFVKRNVFRVGTLPGSVESCSSESTVE
jgi:hypothetical protein